MLLPRFCPNRDCSLHFPDHPRCRCRSCDDRWFTRHGYYRSQVRGIIQRFRCSSCGITFSEQTFRLDYYLKRRISYRRIEQAITSCSGVRAVGRMLDCTPDSVSTRVSRLARQYIAAHCSLLHSLRLTEALAADGFHSFAVSQFYPNNIHLLVGSDSQLLYFLDYVCIRRAGSMTPRQLRLRDALEQLYRAPARGILSSFSHLVGDLVQLIGRSSLPQDTLWTDRKPEYAQAIHRNHTTRVRIAQGTFAHRTVSSRRHRDISNPLFPVNYLDREFRKGLAEHVRETTRFARNVNNSMERLWVYLGVHNYRKRFRENRPSGDTRTHAQTAGISRQAIARATAGIYTRRRFLSREPTVRGRAETLWRRGYETPLRGEDPGLLRVVRKLGARRAINVKAIRREMKISKPQRPVPEYLPAYALG